MSQKEQQLAKHKHTQSSALLQNQILPYNSTYPFTAARKEGNYKIFKIAVIADPDKSSRRDGKGVYFIIS